MKENYYLGDMAEIGSGTAIDREGAGAFAITVGDVGADRFVPSLLGQVAILPNSDDLRLHDGDVVISLRGKRNGASIFSADPYGGCPVYASLDLAILRVREPDEDIVQGLCVWLNLDSTQARLAKFRMGSHALRLPLPALRHLEVPRFEASLAAKLHSAEAALRHAKHLESEIASLRDAMAQALLAKAAENCSLDTDRKEIS